MVASHYTHWRDQGNPADPYTVLARRLPFEQWCRCPDTYPLWSNPQATALCTPRIPPTRAEAQGSPEGATIPVPASELSERAVATLDEVDVVATTDDLLQVYRACLRRLGIEPSMTEALRDNTGQGLQSDISPATRDWLLEHNSIDTALYDKAARRGSQLADAERAASIEPPPQTSTRGQPQQPTIQP